MNHLMPIIALFSMAAMCADGSADGLITDGNYVFTVTHFADHPPVPPAVHFPYDTIADSSYKPTDSITSHTIRFSSRFDTVYIDTNTYGVKSSTAAARIQYDLISSLGVCGRFVIWENSVPLQAELTRYGFGVPIINSEKGILDPVNVLVKTIPMSLCGNRARPKHGSQQAFLINGRIVGNISNGKKVVLKNNWVYRGF